MNRSSSSVMNYRQVFTGSTQDAAEAGLSAGIKSEKQKPSKPFGSTGRVLQGEWSSTSGFACFADLPKPYNFAFSIYCRNSLSPLRTSGGDGGEGMALWGWCRRSAVEGSVSHTLVISDIVLPSTQAFLALDV